MDFGLKRDHPGGGNNAVIREIIDMITAPAGKGLMPDQIADGLIPGVTTSSGMFEAIHREFRAISNGRQIGDSPDDPNREWTDGEIASDLAKAQPADRQDGAFRAANVQNDRSAPIAIEDFTPESVGATFIVGGVPVRVLAVNMDSLGADVESVVLDGGRRFGRQVLGSGDTLFAEAAGLEEGALFSSPAPQPSLIRPLDSGRQAGDAAPDERLRDPSAILEDLTGQAPRDGARNALADGEKRRKHGRVILTGEGLAQWAGENGRTLNPDPITEAASYSQIAGGEHRVIEDADSGRVIKLTKPGLFGAQGEDVVILAGGAGSGKTTAGDIKKASKDFAIDTVLGSRGSVEKRISEARENGREAAIVYVFTPFEKAFPRVIDRFLDEADSRLVPLAVAVDGHLGAQQNILNAPEEAVIRIIDNSRGKGQHRFIDKTTLLNHDYTSEGQETQTLGRESGQNRPGDHGQHDPQSEGGGHEAARNRLLQQGGEILGQYRQEGKLTDRQVSAFLQQGEFSYAMSMGGILRLEEAIARRMTRGPDERAEYFQRLASTVLMLRESKRNLATDQSDTERERNRIRDAMAEAQAIIKALPPEARGRVPLNANDILDADTERGQRNANPLSPSLRSAQRLFQWPPAKSKFLAVNLLE